MQVLTIVSNRGNIFDGNTVERLHFFTSDGIELEMIPGSDVRWYLGNQMVLYAVRFDTPTNQLPVTLVAFNPDDVSGLPSPVTISRVTFG